jgi:hypothetical protein
MSKYFFRFVIALLTFIMGIGLYLFYLKMYSPAKVELIEEIEKPNTVQSSEAVENPRKISFGKVAGGSGYDNTNEKISFMSFLSSDGKHVEVNHFYVGNSYRKEYIRYKKRLKKASKILEVTPILDEEGKQIGKRTLFEEDGEVKVLKLFKVDEEEYYAPFEFYEIIAPDLKTMFDFENR